MEEHGKVYVQKCEILGKEAYILRAEKNANGQGDHNLDIIEVVSDINFRKSFNLEEKSKITILV